MPNRWLVTVQTPEGESLSYLANEVFVTSTGVIMVPPGKGNKAVADAIKKAHKFEIQVVI